MRHNVFFALLWKETRERWGMRKGRAGDFLLRALFALGLGAVFLVFFGKFAKLYLAIPTQGMPDGRSRLFELFSLSFFLLLLTLTAGAAGAIGRKLLGAEDVRLLATLPIGRGALFFGNIVPVFAGQFLFSAAALLLLILPVARQTELSWDGYARAGAAALLLPLFSVALGALFALPYDGLRRALRTRFTLAFLLAVVLVGGGFFLYSKALSAVKDLLLGEELRYFFNAARMEAIGRLARLLFPADLFAGFLLGERGCALRLVLSSAAALAAALVTLRLLLSRALTPPIRRRERGRPRGLRTKRSPFFALLKKEFLTVFRTPSYMTAYLAVAIAAPLMVYFCLSVGGSLVNKVVGLNCSFSLALLLGLLFGALGGVFCASNISREGKLFYSLKAMPLGCGETVWSKVVFCLFVSALSQGATALLLCAAGLLTAGEGGAAFAAGCLFSAAQICFATRYDLAHARFSAEAEGEAQTDGVLPWLLGAAAALAVGGGAVALDLFCGLRGRAAAPAAAFGVGACLLLALLALAYLSVGLRARYESFSGGGLS